MAFNPSEVINLPIGLDYQGTRYREVHIAEMEGVDEENISDKKIRNNGARAMTVLLQRCVQAIPGLVERKSDPYELIPAKYIRGMYTPDRDFIFLCVQALGMEETVETVVRCPRPTCGATQDEVVELEDLEVYDWDEDAPPEIEVSLPVGFRDKDGKVFKDVTWRFPTGIQQEKLAKVKRQQVGTASIASCLQKIEGFGKPDTESVRRLKTRDRVYLMNQVREMTPGVDLRVETTCEECGHEFLGEVDLNSFFSGVGAENQKTMPNGTNGRRKRRRTSSRS